MYVSNDQSSTGNKTQSGLPKKSSQPDSKANQKPAPKPEHIKKPTDAESLQDDESEQKVTP